MILTEYDEEKRIKSEKLLSYDEGKISGRKEGEEKLLIRQVIAKFQKGLSCGDLRSDHYIMITKTGGLSGNR